MYPADYQIALIGIVAILQEVLAFILELDLHVFPASGVLVR